MILLALVFASWGVADMLRQRGKVVAVKVGNIEISDQEWQVHYQRELYGYERFLGRRLTSDEINLYGVKHDILRQLVERLLILEDAKANKLWVSDDMAKLEISSFPGFYQDGKFSAEQLENFLRANGLTEDLLIKMQKESVATKILTSAFAFNKQLYSNLADHLLAARSQVKNLATVRIFMNDMKVEHNPTQEELETFIKENPTAFTAPEKRDVSYITFDYNDVWTGESVSDEELQNYFARKKDSYALPEKRRVEQLVLENQSEATQAVEALRAGEKITDLAKKYKVSTPTDLGEISFNGLDAQIRDIVFGLQKGEVSEPVQTAFGWHVFRVLTIQPGKSKKFEEIKEALRKEYIEERKFDNLSLVAQKIDYDIMMGKPLKEIAEQYSLKLSYTAGLQNKVGKPQGTLAETQEFLNAAFSVEEGKSSVVTPAGGQDKFFVVQVNKIYPSHQLPLANVRTQAQEAWIAMQKQRIMADKLQEISKKLTETAQPTQSVLGLSNISFNKFYAYKDNSTISAQDSLLINSLAIGEVSKPLFGQDKVRGKYADLIKVVSVEHVKPEDTAIYKGNVEAEIFTSFEMDIFDQYLDYLRKTYTVNINEAVFANGTEDKDL
jgi:peptidyl-prolyl cis-trans isomerase D